MIVAQVIAVMAGTALVVWTLGSAVKTVVVPRAVITLLTRSHFVGIRKVFNLFAGPKRSFETRDRFMALYAPVSLVALPGTWVIMVLGGFTSIFWGTGVRPFTEAFATSGSSLLTLGFDRPPGTFRIALGFVEAGIGLGLISLMISYLPTIYGAFSRREALVGMLEVRAGLPPSPTALLTRYARIGWLDRIDDDLFLRWESWFIDIEESHSSQPSLVFFRSPHPERSWITAAGCVLDTASIVNSTLDRRHNAACDIMIRSGFLALRRIADMFYIPYDPDPQPTDPILVTRREFDLMCVELTAAGVPLKKDRDQAWRDFSGWRVNYERVLLELCALTIAPPAKWSSDRMDQLQLPRLRFRRRWRAGAG
ncbi:MAG TPA: hypothetical protein VHN36_18255 [Ilumatobacteraceae bacterium]|nr:hypothetical protein [Ilumatobacteraceae bacterium]